MGKSVIYHEITPEGGLEERRLGTNNLAMIFPSFVAANNCHVGVLLRLQQTIAALMANLSHNVVCLPAESPGQLFSGVHLFDPSK